MTIAMRTWPQAELSKWTTLRIGGPAPLLTEVETDNELIARVREADRNREPIFVLGGGSNLVVSDDGPGMQVVRIATRGVEIEGGATRGPVALRVAAGESWDGLVARSVGEKLSGIESMSGIPGLVGATPIQNVGAYGQEVSDVIESVRAYDRQTEQVVEIAARDCGFSYRHSAFRHNSRFVILSVRLVLQRTDVGRIRYAELARTLGITEGESAPIERIRNTVIALRRGKGMVVDSADPDSTSAGSFFMNPIVDSEALAEVQRRAREHCGEAIATQMPQFSAENERYKLSAGWLIEQAGFKRGERQGRAAISSKHALSLVNTGGATASEIVALARRIRDGVRKTFGVELSPEPIFVNCSF